MKKFLFLLALISSSLFALNLNTATMQELTQIKGIGPKKAKAIIDYRKKHKIKSVEDLKNIKGFNNQTIANIKNNVLSNQKSKTTQNLSSKKNKIQNKIQNKKDAIKTSKKTKIQNNIKTKKESFNKKIKNKKKKFFK